MMRKVLIIGGCLLVGFVVSSTFPQKVYAACDASKCNIPLDVRKIYHVTGLPEEQDPCEYFKGKPPDAYHTVCCESHIRDPETEWGFSWSKWCTPPGVVRPPCECDKPCPDGYEKVITSYGPAGECLQCECRPETPPEEKRIPYDLCQRNQKCINCIDGKGEYEQQGPGSWTAIGCLPTGDPQSFVAWLLSAAIKIAGGIALLLMVFAGFQIITSAGDPKRLQAGKEMLTSAIIGLVVIIFAVFLLQLIGVQILQIPGWK